MKKILGYSFVAVWTVVSLHATSPTLAQLIAATHGSSSNTGSSLSSSEGSSSPSLADVLHALQPNSTESKASPSEKDLQRAEKAGTISSSSDTLSEADLLRALQGGSTTSPQQDGPSENQVIHAIDGSEKKEAEDKKLEHQQQLFVKNLLLNEDYEKALSAIADSDVTQTYNHMMTNILIGHYLQDQDILKNAAASMDRVVASYTKALQHFVAAYTQLHVPITLEKSGDVYGVFMKLVHAYAQWYIIYKQTILQELATNQDYEDNVRNLLKNYIAYNSSMMGVIGVLPASLQDKATKLYHAYLVDNLVQVCVSLLQNYANKGIIDDSDIALMQQVYDVLWQVQFDGMQVMGFSSYQNFVESITHNVAGVYEVNAQSCLNNIDFAKEMSTNTALFDRASQYYQQAAKVYQQGNQQSSVKAMQKKAKDVQSRKSGIVAAVNLYEKTATLLEKDNQMFALATKDVESDITQLQSAAQNLLNVKKTYDDVHTTLSGLGDDVHASLALIKSSQAEADLFIRQAQIMWLTYLKNDELELQHFFDMQSGWNAHDTLQSLQKLQTICVRFPNDISKVSAVIPDLQQALRLYGDQSVHISNKETSNSQLLVLLQDAISFLQNFSSWIDLITALGSTDIIAHADGLADTVQKAVSQGKLLDQAYVSNDHLAMLIPNFAQSVMPAGMQSFQNVAATYAYIVAKQQADTFIVQAHAATDQVQKITLQASALSYYSAAKSVEQFLSHDQQTVIDEAVATLSAAVDVKKQAQNAKAAASACGNWTKIAGSTTYASQATLMWQKAINMNFIAVSIASASEKQAAKNEYLQVVQEYVQAYKVHAPSTVESLLNELLLYYRLYLGYVIVGDEQQHAVLTDITNLVTTFFEEVSTLLSTEAAEKDQTKAYQESEQVAALVISFESAVEQQNLIVEQMQHLFDSVANLQKVFVKKMNEDKSLDLQFVVGGHVQKSVHIPDLVAVKVAHAIAAGDDKFNQAVALEKTEKFYEAASLYTAAQNEYKVAVLSSQDQTVIDAAKQKYFLSVTRAKASLLAGMIVAHGEDSKVKDVDVPSGYVIRQYQMEIPMSFVAPLPTAIAALQNKGFVEPSSSIKQIVLDMFYGFVVSQILVKQQLNFDHCYESYQLARKSGLSSSVMQQLDEVEIELQGLKQAIDSCMSDGFTVDGGHYLTSYKMYVQNTGITLSWEYFPIDAVTPLYTTMPYGAEYAIGAYALFKPGTHLLQLGGGGPSYVPGQDQSSATAMQIMLANMYVVQALESMQTAQDLQQKLIADVTKDVASTHFSLENYMTEFQVIISLYDAVLSLLMVQGQSAAVYFSDVKNRKAHNAVISYVASVYEKQAVFMKQCLVGDPTTNAYATVLKNLNMVYLSQGALPGSDKNQFDEKIAELFKQAGDACMSYEYVDSMTGLHQHNCIDAASNYSAAAAQYKKIGNLDKEKQMKILSNKAYFYACAENMQSYFAAKNHGVNYVNSSGTQVHVTWDKLMTDYQSFENQYSLQSSTGVDPNEIALYNNVKNLLLDAAIYYQVVDNNFGQLALSSTTASQIHSDMVAFLQSKQIVATSATDIDYLNAAINEKISLLAIAGYQSFSSDVAKCAAWAGVLFEAVGYTYIYDFLGGIVGSTRQAKAQDAQLKWNSVTQAMQVAGTAIQNPSAAYVG